MSGGRRWAATLLRMYPRSFRDRFGDEFLRLFTADWSSSSAVSAPRIFLRRARLVAEAVAHGLLEYASGLMETVGLTTGRPVARAGRRTLGAGLALDVTSAVRDLWRSPGFTAVGALTLAAGIGVNAAVYTLVESVALRPLPYPDAERLAAVRVLRDSGQPWPGLSLVEFRAIEARSDLFAGVGAIRPNYAEVLPMDLDVTGVQQPEKLQGIEVTPGLLPLLGIAPAQGRSIADEDRDGDDGQALGFMLSHEYWSRAFGADPGSVGQSLMVEHRPKTIVGVLPPDTRLLLDPRDGVVERADLWTRAYYNAGDDTGSHYLRTVVRLRDEVSFEMARAALAEMASVWQDDWPDAYDPEPLRVELVPLREHLIASVRPVLRALAAAVALVLLVACANVGSLILARGRARGRDLAVRRALGASRGQIGRLVLVESLILASLGAAVGLALAALSMRAIQLMAAGSLPRASDISLGAGTVGFTLALALVSAALAGGLAVAQGRGGELVNQLRQGPRIVGSRRAAGYRGLLTVIQTALAVVLLIAAGLMLRTLVNLARVDLGFNPEGVFTFKVEMDQTQIDLGPPRYEFFRDVAATVAEQPEFDNASAIFVLPTHGGFGVDRYGRTTEELEASDHLASFNVVLPGYFDTMGIALTSGSDFAPEWPAGDGGEVIIDEQIAERLWPGEEAVGRTLWVDWDMQNPEVQDRVMARVVGVARHARQDGIRDLGTPQIYVPHWHRPFWGMNFVARFRGSAAGPAAATAAIRAVQRVVDADPDAIFMHSGRELTSVIAEESQHGRLLTRVLATFSALALLLTASGLYGVISYGARQRTREIGIRRATGARTGDIAWLILRGALRLSAIGVALGVAGAMWLSRLLTNLLFGVAPADPLTYVVAGALLFGVGVLAAASPAMRAAAIDPVHALRTE